MTAIQILLSATILLMIGFLLTKEIGKEIFLVLATIILLALIGHQLKVLYFAHALILLGGSSIVMAIPFSSSLIERGTLSPTFVGRKKIISLASITTMLSLLSLILIFKNNAPYQGEREGTFVPYKDIFIALREEYFIATSLVVIFILMGLLSMFLVWHKWK